MKYSIFLAITFLQICHLNAVPINMVDARGVPHAVGRSGILPVKDYGHDDIHGLGSRHAIILGVAVHSNCAGPFSGQCDATDPSVWDAAARECAEETSGALDLRRKPPLPDVLFTGLPTKGPQNALFVLFDNNISVREISTHNQRALSGEIHADKPGCWRENDHAVAIDFPTLHALLTLSRTGGIPNGTPVSVKTRSGQDVRLDKAYINTLLSALPILQQRTGYSFFKNPTLPHFSLLFNINNIISGANMALAWSGAAPVAAVAPTAPVVVTRAPAAPAINAGPISATPLAVDPAIIDYMRWLGSMSASARNAVINKISDPNRLEYLNWIFSMNEAARTAQLGYNVPVNTN
jgi:hypothetical protein